MSWRWLLIVFTVVALTGVHAAPVQEPELSALAQQAPTADDFPDQDAVWLLRDMEITVDPAGAFTVRERRVVKVLTEQGLALAQWQIPYDTACETIEVPLARTMVDGQIVPLNPALMSESAVYPGTAWYDSMLVRRFPLPAARVGAIFEVETVIHHTVPRVPHAFSTRLYLQQRYPLYRQRFTVRLPADQRLAIRFTGGDVPVEERQEQGQRIYAWELRDVPAFTRDEPLAPPIDDLIRSVRLTSLTGWAPVVEWYRTITAGKDAVTPELQRLAEERTAGCASTEEKIAALHKVVRELPYVATEMGELSDTPHSAVDVARLGYGDCKDKATLMRALLSAVGIPCDYVLIRTTDRGQLDTLQYGADEFNHVILAVPLPDGDRFLDATLADVPADQLPPGVDSAGGLIIRQDGELVILPAMTAAMNRTEINIAATVAEDGSAQGKLTITLTGQNAMPWRGMLGTVRKERYRETLERAFATRLGTDVALGDVAVEHLRAPEQPLIITAQFTSASYLQRAGDQWVGSLPAFTYQPNVLRGVTSRRYPFAQSTEGMMHVAAQITVPATWTVAHLPAPIEQRMAPGDFFDTVRVVDHTIHYTCEFRTKRGVFPADTLPTMRRWAGVLALEGRNPLQFFLRCP